MGDTPPQPILADAHFPDLFPELGSAAGLSGIEVHALLPPHGVCLVVPGHTGQTGKALVQREGSLLRGGAS